jgi:hypothetical protein
MVEELQIKKDLIPSIYLIGILSNGAKLLQNKINKHHGKELIIQLSFSIHI